MTLTANKTPDATNKTPDTTKSAHTPQSHMKAAEHLDMASKSHKEAAKQISAGDHKAAAQHAATAKEHTQQAGQQLTPSTKSSTQGSPQHA